MGESSTTLLCPRNTVKMSGRPARFNQTTLIDTTPLPADIPPVTEIGSSSAPLLSASFFIGARCKAYNDDFMQCKTESGGRGEIDCLTEFRKHWTCLDNNNQQLWQCRPAEWKLNKCVFDNLKIEKVIPDTPKGETPVHLKTRQIYSHHGP